MSQNILYHKRWLSKFSYDLSIDVWYINMKIKPWNFVTLEKYEEQSTSWHQGDVTITRQFSIIAPNKVWALAVVRFYSWKLLLCNKRDAEKAFWPENLKFQVYCIVKQFEATRLAIDGRHSKCWMLKSESFEEIRLKSVENNNKSYLQKL